jgi:tripartite-type tricarboxylate transporter receptor subunit TctC
MSGPIRLAFLAGLAMSLLASAVGAQQAAMPPLIRMIVPFAAGGSTDVMARSLARELEPRLGTKVIVENRAGAGSLLGSDSVAKGPRDGSLVLFTTASLVTAAATARAPTFDVNADLQPIAMLGEGPMVVAVPASSAVRNPADLVAAARARPDALNYGSAGVGTIGHLTAELINDAAGISTRHVPYRGTAMVLTDLATGTIDWTVAIQTTLQPQIDAGRVRVIGVTTREESPSFPGVPPMASAAKGLDASTWVAVFVPAGTPAALVERYNRAINEAAKSKAITDQMMADGMIGTALSPTEIAPKVGSTYAMWKRLAGEKKILVE